MSEEMQRAVKRLRDAFEHLREADNLCFVSRHPDEFPEWMLSHPERQAIANPDQASLNLSEAWDGMSTAVYYVEKHAAKVG